MYEATVDGNKSKDHVTLDKGLVGHGKKVFKIASYAITTVNSCLMDSKAASFGQLF